MKIYCPCILLQKYNNNNNNLKQKNRTIFREKLDLYRTKLEKNLKLVIMDF